MDAQLENKNTLDFKQRILKQQKYDATQAKHAARKRDEDELKLLKIKQRLDQAQSKKQYFEDLSKQKIEKHMTERQSLQLQNNEFGSSRKPLTDFSKTPTMSAMIPGINNWKTVGSTPILRGLNKKQKEFESAGNILAFNKFNPPKMPSARLSKYEKLKSLENEYFEYGLKGK